MDSKKNQFTFKIAFSYLLLVVLGAVASYYIYNEVRNYVTNETATVNDDKLLKTNSFLAQLYEAESLSKLAFQSKNKLNFIAYENKIDSIHINIEELKKLTESEHQKSLLDSLSSLLIKKAKNINALRSLRMQNQTGTAINTALKEFDKLEASLGIITPESLAPNFNELSPKLQETLKKLANYLNANIPEENNPQLKAQRMDSVLQVSKNLLKEVQQENTLNENSLARRETAINRTDVELSQQLRSILSSFEQEIFMNSMANTLKKESLLKRSIRLAALAALLGFLVVGIFTFILNRDFWKVNLLREKLVKEKDYSVSLLKSREQLIATVSHDLRTPLNTISGFASLIEKSGTKKEKEYVAHIQSASTYVNNLVNDLLDFSQLEAGKMVAKKTTFRMDTLITESAKNIASQYASKDIELKLDLDTSLHRPLITDAFRMRQILSNLLGNAFKFTETGSITLTGKILQQSQTLVLEVKDTGIGISKEKQKLIFKEFIQAEGDTDKKYGGYGLGLTITKKLTELLKGTLSVKSELGSGSSFTLQIPIEYGEFPEAASEPEHDYPNLNALVFDDDSGFLILIGKMMESLGITALLHTDFNDFDPKSDSVFDFVLTDIEMPTVSGYEISSRLRSGTYPMYKNQPILAMTGRRDLSLEHFAEQGFDQLLRKPFSTSDLAQKLNKLLYRSDLQSTLKVSKPIAETEGEFSLSTLNQFLGDDTEALHEIVFTFKKDSLQNLDQLQKAVDEFNILDIKQTAHRMLPMFRQLKVIRAIPLLEAFEILEQERYDKETLLKMNKELKRYTLAVLDAISVELPYTSKL